MFIGSLSLEKNGLSAHQELIFLEYFTLCNLLMLHVYRKRVTGEEWFIRTPGAYLPGVFEEVSTFLFD